MTDSNIVYRLYEEHLGNSHVSKFKGHRGAIFYDPDVGELRLGDGETAGGISLFKALASNFGMSVDGGNTIINDFNIITYDGGNATSPFDVYDVIDGNQSTNQSSIDVGAHYTFTNTITFSNNITVTGVVAGGTQGKTGQVLTSSGNGNVVWANVSMGGGTSGVAANTTLEYNNGLAVVANSADATVSVGNGSSYTIPDFSGMLIVNDHYDGGVALYIAGGGNGVLISNTNSAFDTTLTQNGNGYNWTNSTNLTGPFTFTVIKTRNGA